MSAKPRVLILTDWYVPGYKAGGPITSVYKMVKELNSDVDFSIITRNHDWHDPEPFNVPVNEWIEREGARVLYVSDASASNLWREIDNSDVDMIYFNGIYAPTFHALPILRFLLKRERPKLIVAPRGMLNPNAIALKSIKKKVLLATYRMLRIDRKVLFHSTGPNETDAIGSAFSGAEIREISNVPATPGTTGKQTRKGFLSVARLSPVKNTLPLLELFASMQKDQLTLIGTADDASYMQKCQWLIESAENIDWVGGVGPDRLHGYYAEARYFISMTTGENFGHAIIEALAAGCPVIISDRTPWNDLETSGAGWVIPLKDKDRWKKVLVEAAELDEAKYQEMSSNAIAYVKRKFDLEQLREQYKQLFGATN